MKRHSLGAATVVLIAGAGLGFIMISPEVMFNRHSDLVGEHLATQTVLHDSWTRGAGIPLWRDDQLSGAPAFTNPQAAYSHPVHTLFAFFPPARVIGVVMWIEMVLAALGAYLAAAVLNLSMAGRLLTAIGTLFSFKTILAVYAGFLPALGAVAALPFVFAATLVVLDRRSLAGAIGLALAGALALHAGHPQLTYYTAVFVALWGVVHVAREALVDARAAARLFAVLFAAAALAVGLAAYRLLPIAADLPLVTRSEAGREMFIGTGPMPVLGLFTILYPEYFGTPLNDSYPEGWEYILYLGVVPTLLAAFALMSGHGGRHVTALRVGFLLSAALAIDTPLLRLVAHLVPAYALFRVPARILFLTAFFGYCLAGVGLDQLLTRIPARRRLVLAAVLMAIVAVEGAFWARRYLRSTDAIPFPAMAPYVDALRTTEPGRIASLSASTPNFGSTSPLGLQLVPGYDPFIFRHYQTYTDIVQFGQVAETHPAVWSTLDQIVRWDLVDALNVAFVVSPAPLRTVPPGYVLAHVFEDQPQFRFYEGVVRGPVHIYRNERRLQRAFFVSSVRAVASEQEMLDEVLRRDLRAEAVVLGGTGHVSAASPTDRIDVRRVGGGVVELITHSTKRRFLVISEVWHPGWRATIDGVPATLHRADIALQGLWLDPGTHAVAVRFWPPGLSAGLTVTGGSVGVLLISLAAHWRRRRNFAAD